MEKHYFSRVLKSTSVDLSTFGQLKKWKQFEVSKPKITLHNFLLFRRQQYCEHVQEYW